jgi:hypothetical protein
LKRLAGLLIAVWLVSLTACVNLKPGRCDHDTDCKAGYRCNLDPTPQGNGRCVLTAPGDGGDAMPPTDGGADKTGDGVPGDGGPGDVRSDKPEANPACTAATCSGTMPICDGTSKACRACSTGGECAALSSSTSVCAATGACVECATSGQCGVAGKPICDTASNACRACGSSTECAARDATLPACATSGKCVECVMNTDCKMASKPICDQGQSACRACQADSECPADPGVCMTDGHCATSAEVIFVEFNAAGCPMADGSSAKPFCAPNDGVAALTAARHVIVIRGAANNQMSVATTGMSPVIVGRRSSEGDSGSIPAGATAALTVSSDEVLVRDLILGGGLGSGAKGVLATGASTKVTLLRVTANLGTGLGVDAESGASLTMDQCYVQNNSAGGIVVNGAKYDIQNSVIAGNGLGVKFSASAIATGSRFWFNTIAGSAGSAVTCDSSNPQTLASSVVVGVNDSCTLTNSVTAAPTFSATRPFHLTAHLACPAAPATFPDHDIDGDPRVAPIDCDADQFVP